MIFVIVYEFYYGQSLMKSGASRGWYPRRRFDYLYSGRLLEAFSGNALYPAVAKIHPLREYRLSWYSKPPRTTFTSGAGAIDMGISIYGIGRNVSKPFFIKALTQRVTTPHKWDVDALRLEIAKCLVI
jgi:hypothetical protein